MKDLLRVGTWLGSGVLLAHYAPLAYRAATGGMGGGGDEFLCRVLGLTFVLLMLVTILGLLICQARCRNGDDRNACTDRCINIFSLIQLALIFVFGTLLVLFCPPRTPL